jgi:protease I
MLQTVVHDRQPEVMETSTERLAYRIQADASADEINPEEYDALIIPGGRAPEYIRTFPRVLEVVGHFLDKNKPVAAICHAALILTTPELKDKLAGRSLTCVRTCRFEVQGAGMHFIEELIHQDGNLVSGQTWRDLPSFMKAFFKVLREQ